MLVLFLVPIADERTTTRVAGRFAYLAHDTEALCEAAGEEIKAYANAAGWRIDYLCTDGAPRWPMR